jgi:hypothetical protein
MPALVPIRFGSSPEGTPKRPLIAGVAGGGSGGDPYWNNVVLLLSFDGANGDVTGAGFTDESPALHGTAITPFIGAGSLSDTQSQLGYNTSMHFAGGGGRFWFPDSEDFNLSNRRYTIEYWFRPASTAFAFHVCQWSDAVGDLGWVVGQSDAYLESISTTGSNVIALLASAGVLAANNWYAGAVTFDGTAYRGFINGVMVAKSTTLYTVFNSLQFLMFGANQLGAFSYVGYMQEFRMTMDVDRYPGDGGYVPATLPFPRFGT